ncbi:YfbU family protein [Acinetobacter sp. LF10]|uniref:YfbU family protein n=1 Tax=Acinetobacter sp. LF10 TaxID=3403576 RepID=UPI003B226F23
MKIELTDKERLFLANQHEILSHLDADNSDYHLKLAEQLRDGHKWLYSQSFDNFSENLSDDDAELVLNILQIYQMIEDAYDGLSDKSLISEHQIKFPGFDGNNETEFMGFVDALEKSHCFTDVIQNGHRNSHSAKVHVYKRMIAKWQEFGEPYSLTKEQLIEILGR